MTRRLPLVVRLVKARVAAVAGGQVVGLALQGHLVGTALQGQLVGTALQGQLVGVALPHLQFLQGNCPGTDLLQVCTFLLGLGHTHTHTQTQKCQLDVFRVWAYVTNLQVAVREVRQGGGVGQGRVVEWTGGCGQGLPLLECHLQTKPGVQKAEI